MFNILCWKRRLDLVRDAGVVRWRKEMEWHRRNSCTERDLLMTQRLNSRGKLQALKCCNCASGGRPKSSSDASRRCCNCCRSNRSKSWFPPWLIWDTISWSPSPPASLAASQISWLFCPWVRWGEDSSSKLNFIIITPDTEDKAGSGWEAFDSNTPLMPRYIEWTLRGFINSFKNVNICIAALPISYFRKENCTDVNNEGKLY